MQLGRKHSRHFNAIFETRVLQSLAGCEYFPFAFSEFDGKLVIELITCEDTKVVTVSSMQKENKLTSADWKVICFSLASAIKSMHLKNLLHNDLKSNNVLLKLRNNVSILKTKTLDFIISFQLHLVYQAACHITGVLSCIYTFFCEKLFYKPLQ